MWILIVVAIMIGAVGNSGGITGVNSIKFNTEKACKEAVSRINKVDVYGVGQSAEAFCVYDEPLPELNKKLNSLDKALEKTFPNKKK